MKKFFLVGAFHEVIEAFQDSGVEVDFLVDPSKQGKYFGIQIFGNDEAVLDRPDVIAESEFVISLDLPEIRRLLAQKYCEAGATFRTFVSADSTVSESCQLGHGSLVMRRANLSSFVRLGDFVRVNALANVMHDVTIGDFSTIAPNAVLLGNVVVGEGCYIGANSTILPGLTIGGGATVGAGSVVTKNVGAGLVVAGNPARILGSN